MCKFFKTQSLCTHACISCHWPDCIPQLPIKILFYSPVTLDAVQASGEKNENSGGHFESNFWDIFLTVVCSVSY